MSETIPLFEAMLCQRCLQISPAGSGRCLGCGGGALVNLAHVLDRHKLRSLGTESITERVDRLAKCASRGSGWARLIKSL